MLNSFRKARMIQGLTQAELAEKLGVSTVSVSQWENGRNYPDVKRLKTVASVLGTTVEELLKETKKKEVI